MTRLHTIVVMIAFTLGTAALASAQEKPAAAPSDAAIVPLKVQLTIARYQGEKRISSVPYILAVSTGGPRNMAHLRMGAQVPIVAPNVTASEAKLPSPIQYKDVGTNIDCSAMNIHDDPRAANGYLLSITIEDSSVYPENEAPAAVKGSPSFRSFRITETVVLRDGQSTQFVAATDKLTGETVKVDVTLTVVK